MLYIFLRKIPFYVKRHIRLQKYFNADFLEESQRYLCDKLNASTFNKIIIYNLFGLTSNV